MEYGVIVDNKCVFTTFNLGCAKLYFLNNRGYNSYVAYLHNGEWIRCEYSWNK